MDGILRVLRGRRGLVAGSHLSQHPAHDRTHRTLGRRSSRCLVPPRWRYQAREDSRGRPLSAGLPGQTVWTCLVLVPSACSLSIGPTAADSPRGARRHSRFAPLPAMTAPAVALPSSRRAHASRTLRTSSRSERAEEGTDFGSTGTRAAFASSSPLAQLNGSPVREAVMSCMRRPIGEAGSQQGLEPGRVPNCHRSWNEEQDPHALLSMCCDSDAMRDLPHIVIHAPDERGLRTVTVQGKTIGKALSVRDLRRIMRRAGLPADINLDDRGRVHWVGGKDLWPDRPWRRRAKACFMGLGLLVSATFLFIVGSKDAFRALTWGGRLVGVAFMVASLVEAIGMLGLIDYWRKRSLRYSGEFVLLGVLAVLMTNLVCLVMQIEGGDYTPWLWLWIGLLTWAAWALWVLNGQNVWQRIPHPQRFAVGVAVSTVIGAAGMTYSQMYVPYSTPAIIDFSSSFGRPVLDSGKKVLHVPAHIVLKNSGSVRIYVVGTLWKVRGLPGDYLKAGTGLNEWKDDMLAGRPILRHDDLGPSRLLGAGEIVWGGSWLDPGDDFSTDVTVKVPMDSGMGRVEIQSLLSYIRADRCKLGNDYKDSFKFSWDTKSNDKRHTWDAPKWVADSGDEFFRYASRIYRSSKILEMTRSSDYASAWWVAPKWHEGVGWAEGDTDPYMKVSISRDPQAEQQLTDSEQEPYGMKTLELWRGQTVDQLLQAGRK